MTTSDIFFALGDPTPAIERTPEALAAREEAARNRERRFWWLVKWVERGGALADRRFPWGGVRTRRPGGARRRSAP
jgi:hypothetical protein